uniref:C2H2-type domain-containing protein n=1 Tax=Trichogramma kaykai TaxID=54128 RepID=A0ABD2XBJ0_9HYME
MKQEMDDTWLSAGEDYIFNSVNSGGDQNFEVFSFYKSSTNHINETMALAEKLDKKISIEFECKDVKLELPSLSTTICKTEYQSYPSIVKIENNIQTNYLYEKRLLNLIENDFDYDKNNQFQEKSRIKVNRLKKVEICMKKTHLLSHKCNLCRKIYEGEASTKTHINTTYESIGQYECDICHKSCSFQGNPIENMNTVHDRIKLFECDIRNKSYGEKYNLKTDINAIHNRSKPFECDICYK